MRCLRWCKRLLPLLALASLLGLSRPGDADPPKGGRLEDSARAESVGPVSFIDLAGALRLAGVENLDMLLARERVEQAVALRQLAAAQFLPNLNAGLNADAHTGPLQQASGNILKVNRDALYLGAGANAVAAGTVNIPGIVYNLHVSDTIFRALASRQLVERRRFANLAIQNEMLRRVASAYLELLRAEGLRGVTLQTRLEAEQVAKMTAAFVKAKQGRQADADRAATELADRIIDQEEAEQTVSLASTRLAELLNLDPTTRLHPVEERVVPLSVVPNAVPLPELLAIAMLQRPELGEQQALIRQAFLDLSAARVLPFSPNLIVGFSGGWMGGGSNIVANQGQSRFGNFRTRNDFDAVLYWTLQNLGVGNVALIRAAESRSRGADLEQLEVLNRVRAEVAQAFIETRVQFARTASTEESVRAGVKAFQADFARVKGIVGLPIELLQSLRLLGQARHEYLNAIAGYNQAELNLYVALGQPPMDTLVRPVPTNFAPGKSQK